MKPIKVLVVDDSAFMRQLITDLLSNDNRIKVVGTARNGQEAIEKIKALSPDCVTLDIEMPIMDGIETLKEIMTHHPLPVIMLSSTTKEDAYNTIRAMEIGAFDFVSKPSGSISLDLYKVIDELIQKIIETKHVNLTRLKVAEPFKKLIEKPKRPITSQLHRNTRKIVLIGTSTGGPRALEKVLTQIPKDLDAPILIVQHMPGGFTKSLAQRLNHACAIHVKEAENGEILSNGVAYIAPGGKHLLVRQVGKTLACELSDLPEETRHRPSVNILFQSASKLKNIKKVAVILTGMGSDGSEGLKDLKQSKDVYAIAESENKP